VGIRSRNKNNGYNYKQQHAYYLRNREQILEKKKLYNQIPEVKERSKINHQKYYQEHKEEINQKHREYSKNRKKK
jgi:hypothetical protein